MFRLPTRTRSGARRDLWIAVATAAVLLATAAPPRPHSSSTSPTTSKRSPNRSRRGRPGPHGPGHRGGRRRPGRVTVSPDGESVYVVNGEEHSGNPQAPFGGSVSQYDVGPGGELSPKSPPKVAAGSAPARVAGVRTAKASTSPTPGSGSGSATTPGSTCHVQAMSGSTTSALAGSLRPRAQPRWRPGGTRPG